MKIIISYNPVPIQSPEIFNLKWQNREKRQILSFERLEPANVWYLTW